MTRYDRIFAQSADHADRDDDEPDSARYGRDANDGRRFTASDARRLTLNTLRVAILPAWGGDIATTDFAIAWSLLDDWARRMPRTVEGRFYLLAPDRQHDLFERTYRAAQRRAARA
jgi:hypothetical protein